MGDKRGIFVNVAQSLPVFSSPVLTPLIFSRYVYCLFQLDLDVRKVNVNGGAIAFGHPLGATRVRQVVTGLAELGRRNERVLVSSMCIGSGQVISFLDFIYTLFYCLPISGIFVVRMGAAAVFVNERVG